MVFFVCDIAGSALVMGAGRRIAWMGSSQMADTGKALDPRRGGELAMSSLEWEIP